MLSLSIDHPTSGSGTVCNTGPRNNRLTKFGHNGSSGGIGGKSIGVGGIGIDVDVEIGVIGGDGGIVVVVVLLWMTR